MDKTKAAVISEMLSDSDQRIAELEGQLAFERRYRNDLAAKQAGGRNGTTAQEIDAQAVMSAGAMPDKLRVLLVGVESMRASEIARQLEAAGVTSDSKKGLLPSVISALRRRDDLFESPERGVYRLKR